MTTKVNKRAKWQTVIPAFEFSEKAVKDFSPCPKDDCGKTTRFGFRIHLESAPVWIIEGLMYILLHGGGYDRIQEDKPHGFLIYRSWCCDFDKWKDAIESKIEEKSDSVQIPGYSTLIVHNHGRAKNVSVPIEKIDLINAQKDEGHYLRVVNAILPEYCRIKKEKGKPDDFSMEEIEPLVAILCKFGLDVVPRENESNDYPL